MSKKNKIVQFESEDITWTFDPASPYELRYFAFGNYEGSRVEGKLSLAKLALFIADLQAIQPYVKGKISYKGKEYTEEDIIELNRLLQEKSS